MSARALLVGAALAVGCKGEPAAKPSPVTPSAPRDAALVVAPDAAVDPIPSLLGELAEAEARIDRATVDIAKSRSKAEADAAVQRLQALREEKQAIERKIYEARQQRTAPPAP